MTVCLAALIKWLYGDGDIGTAAVVASDRMLTLGDHEYEPPDMKICHMGKSALILVAGEMPAHSEALNRAQKELATNPTQDIEEIANIYADKCKEIRRKRAEIKFLHPLGLTYETFIANQSTMQQSIAYDIANQLQSFDLNVEALVVGCDGKEFGHIFVVDSNGTVTRQDDVGFAAIGVGAPHAKAQFMFSRYPRIINYYQALPIVYAAKRRAEVAPGVGKETDFILITREGCTNIDPEVIKLLDGKFGELALWVRKFFGETSKEIENKFVEMAARDEKNIAAKSAEQPSDVLEGPKTIR